MTSQRWRLRDVAYIVIGVAFVLAFLGAPVAAHHVDVEEGTTDREVYETFVNEYAAQFTAVISALTNYRQDPSDYTQALVEQEFATAHEHIEGLAFRACFASFRDLTLLDVDTAEGAFAAHVAGGPLDFAQANVIHGRVIQVLTIGHDVACRG